MERPIVVNADAQFSDSVAGLQAGKKYFAIIVGESLNTRATGDDNKNLVLATVPMAGTELANVTVNDWVNRTASSRALVDAGILSAAQKRKALADATVFEVSWKAGEERTADDGSTYTQKIWSAKRHEEEAE